MKTLSILRCVAALACGALCSTVYAATTTKGTTVTLEVTITKGSAPLKYRWYRNGYQIAGTQVPKLVLKNIRIADSGSYTVHVINAFGQTVSQAEVLTVKSR